MKFDIFQSVSSKGRLCTNDLFQNMIHDEGLIPLYNDIAREENPEHRQELKRRLPAITWQAHFPSGNRKNAEAVPSGLFIIDVDHVDNPGQLYEQKIAGHMDECGIMAVHMTPSMHGLRIVAKCRPDCPDIESNQTWLSQRLDIANDAAVKDMARLSYLVPAQYFYCFDGRIWTDTSDWTPQPAETVHRPVRDVQTSDAAQQTEYGGLSLRAIADRWLELNGGTPQQGERNTVLFELATRMRYICDFSPAAVSAAIPHCGLSDNEVLSLCRSACSAQRSVKMPSDLRMVLRSMVPAASGDSGQESGMEQVQDFLVRLPKLPIGLKESIAGVPDKFKMPILCGIMPLAMSYATNVRVRYCDGKQQRLNLMSIIWGRQASGKSSVKNVIDIWKEPMKRADLANRQVEDEYRQMRKNRKANEKLPPEPRNPILEVPITISCSTLLKRMKNAQGRHLFSFGEELDTLRKSNGAGSWSSKYDVYRLSFDNGEWGQDYNSDNAESGVVDVAYNWTVLGTRGAVDKCFKSDSVENGMSGRVLFSKMADSMFEHMPSFSEPAPVDSDRIGQAVQILSGCQGYYDTPRLRRIMQLWCDDKADEARMNNDEVLDTLRKRSAVIGFRCGVLFHLLEAEGQADRKESRACADFALLMADYALQQQTELFSQQLSDLQQQTPAATRQGRNKTLYAELPPSFDLDTLKHAKPDATSSAIRFMVYNWLRNGMVQATGKNSWTKTVQS